MKIHAPIFRTALSASLIFVVACGGNPGTATLDAAADPCSGAWVRLFEDANFSSQRLTIAYPTQIPLLSAAGTDGGSGELNDRASSAQWSIPAGCKLVLFENSEFRGASFQLIGSGRTEQNPNLGTFADRASSARWERS